MKDIEWGKPNNITMSDVPLGETSLMPLAYRPSEVHYYKKIAGKRFRLPRKVKKAYKKRMCKHGWEIKKLKFSYKRLNQDVDGNKRNHY